MIYLLGFVVAPLKYMDFVSLPNKENGLLPHGNLLKIAFETEATTSLFVFEDPQDPTLGVNWNTGNSYVKEEAIDRRSKTYVCQHGFVQQRLGRRVQAR